MKRVLLFSSGMDSWMAWHFLSASGEQWDRLYFDLLTNYAWKERQIVKRYRPSVKILDNLRLQEWEQEDGFVPQRNALLLTLAQAATDADELALNAVAGEYSRDKSVSFFKQMSQLLSYTANKPVKVFSPLHRWTKARAVTEYLKAGFSADTLLATVSCYNSSHAACGACPSCARAWVALEINHLADQRHWNTPPWDWWKAHHKPLKAVTAVPPAEWSNFMRAQIDVFRAYAFLKQRLSTTTNSLDSPS